MLDLLAGPLSIAPLLWDAIAACVVSGGIIGFERHLHGKPIGMRTDILICLGTYTLVAAGLAISTPSTDPTRVIGQIVTGIGFLGAGVILTRDGIVMGVTTAASIWMLAGIGVIIATQPPVLGIKLSLLCVVILMGSGYLERGLERLSKRPHPGEAHDKPPSAD